MPSCGKSASCAPATGCASARVAKPGARADNPSIVLTLPASATHAEICVRRAGESNLLVEFGAPVLDLVLRFQVQALLEQLARRANRRASSI